MSGSKRNNRRRNYAFESDKTVGYSNNNLTNKPFKICQNQYQLVTFYKQRVGFVYHVRV